jgi:hypothetical protein
MDDQCPAVVNGCLDGQISVRMVLRLKKFCGLMFLFWFRKCTAHVRCLPFKKDVMGISYGDVADTQEDNLRMVESICIEVMYYMFYATVVNMFETTYLRAPNATYTTQLMAQGVKRGFYMMLGTIDYMH